MPWARGDYPMSAVKGLRGKSFGEPAPCRRGNYPVNIWKSVNLKKNGQFAFARHRNSPNESREASREDVIGELRSAPRLNCPTRPTGHMIDRPAGSDEAFLIWRYIIDNHQAAMAEDHRSPDGPDSLYLHLLLDTTVWKAYHKAR